MTGNAAARVLGRGRRAAEIPLDGIHHRELVELNPLIKIASVADDAAEAVASFFAHHAFSMSGDILSAEIAISIIDNTLIKIAKNLSGWERSASLARLGQLRRSLEIRMGKTVELDKAVSKLLKNAARTHPPTDPKAVQHASDILQKTWSDAVSGKWGPKEKAIFEKLAESLNLGEPAILKELAELASRIPKGKEEKFYQMVEALKGQGNLKSTDDIFQRAFGGKTNAFKGKLMEIWFYNHKIWTRILKKRYYDEALKLAEELNRTAKPPFEPLVVTSVAKDANNKEIYDGMVLLVRKRTPDSKVLEGHLVVAVEIKSERKTSALTQHGRNQARENDSKSHLLRFSDGGREQIVNIQPAAEFLPTRLVVAPHQPGSKAFQNAKIFGEVEYYKPMLSAQETETALHRIIMQLAEAHVGI